MRRAVCAPVFALLLTFASVGETAPTTWTIDPGHSRVGFSIRHIFSRAQGQFTKFSGAVIYDPRNPAASSVKAEIDAASIDTKKERRDTHLKSEDFFFVEKYPTITFQSTKVTPVGEDKLKVEGNLTMRGITKPVTLDATFLGAGPTFKGEQRSGFEAVTKVNRKDYNIVWNEALDHGGTLLGDEVDIRINIEGVVIPPEVPAKAPAGSKKSQARK